MGLLLIFTLFSFLRYACSAESKEPSRFSEQAPYYFHIKANEHNRCRGAIAKCDSCISNGCTESEHRREVSKHVRELDRCHAELSELRYGIPDWCLFNEDGFFVDPRNPPPRELCDTMDVKKCSDRWFSEMEGKVNARRLSESDIGYKMAESAMIYGSLVEEIGNKEKEMKGYPIWLEQYKVEKEHRLLEQAQKHLADLEEEETLFADPVYIGLDRVKEENKRLETLIEQQDIMPAYDKNRKVRRKTVNRIPGILDSIESLQNRISSRKGRTDALLNEIKRISRRTASLQRQSTNLVYELAHSRHLEADVNVMDTGLLSMYSALQRESDVLGEENLKATFAKLRLVGAMRRLVWEISRRQAELGCDIHKRIAL